MVRIIDKNLHVLSALIVPVAHRENLVIVSRSRGVRGRPFANQAQDNGCPAINCLPDFSPLSLGTVADCVWSQRGMRQVGLRLPFDELRPRSSDRLQLGTDEFLL